MFSSAKSLNEGDVLRTDHEEKVQDISGKPWYGKEEEEEEGKKAINGRGNIEKECHAVLIILDRFNLRRWRREL